MQKFRKEELAHNVHKRGGLLGQYVVQASRLVYAMACVPGSGHVTRPGSKIGFKGNGEVMC